MNASAIAVWLAMIGQMLLLNRRLGGAVAHGPRAYDSVKSWLAISLPILMVEGFYLLLSYIDVLVLQQFRPSEEVGIYYRRGEDAGAGIVHPLRDVGDDRAPLQRVPHVGDHERLSSYLAHAIKWTFWPSLAATVGLLAFGKPLLWLFGPQFTAGYPMMFILVDRPRGARGDRPDRAAPQHDRPAAHLRAAPTRSPS